MSSLCGFEWLGRGKDLVVIQGYKPISAFSEVEFMTTSLVALSQFII